MFVKLGKWYTFVEEKMCVFMHATQHVNAGIVLCVFPCVILQCSNECTSVWVCSCVPVNAFFFLSMGAHMCDGSELCLCTNVCGLEGENQNIYGVMSAVAPVLKKDQGQPELWVRFSLCGSPQVRERLE